MESNQDIPPSSLAPTGIPLANETSRRELLRVVVATSLVNGLEIFNFTVFGFFAGMIGKQFFPAADPMTSLLLAVGTFGVGFFMRPFGAAVIGTYADRVGRRTAMTATIWLTAAGTAAVAVCPPYSMIGVAAPLILVVGRSLQGFAAGGEMGAATTLVMEAGPVSRRGFRVSWQLASQGAAALLGASLGTLLASVMSPGALESWGWRIPFLIGLLIVPVGLYVRRQGLADRNQETLRLVPRTPLAELCHEHGRTLALATLMIVGRTVPAYAIVLYMPSYLAHVMHLPPISGFLASAFSALVLVVVSPLSGLLADRLKRRKPLVLGASVATTVLIYPLFLLITHGHGLLPVLVGVGVVSTLVALTAGAGTLLILEAFPLTVRASGLAISYALAVTLFGGTAQFIVTALIKWTGNPMAVAWYVTGACLLSVVSLVLFKEHPASI